MPDEKAWQTAFVVFCLCEIILVFLVAKAWLPGTKYVFPIGESFSETQFAFVANLVAGGSMLLARGESGEAFRWLINAAILVCVLVYFVTKSVVMRKVRFKVLMAGILPVAQFFL